MDFIKGKSHTMSHPIARASPSTWNKSASPTTPALPATCPGLKQLCRPYSPSPRPRPVAVSIAQNLRRKSLIRKVSFSLGDLKRVRMRSQVDRSTYTTHLPTDTAHTKLIRHRCARLDCERNSTTMATSLELDWHEFCVQRKKEGLGVLNR